MIDSAMSLMKQTAFISRCGSRKSPKLAGPNARVEPIHASRDDVVYVPACMMIRIFTREAAFAGRPGLTGI